MGKIKEIVLNSEKTRDDISQSGSFNAFSLNNKALHLKDFLDFEAIEKQIYETVKLNDNQALDIIIGINFKIRNTDGDKVRGWIPPDVKEIE